MPDLWALSAVDADQYRIQVASVPINRGPGQSGFGEDEFLKISTPKKSFEVQEGADGFLQRNKTNTRLVLITIRLLQASPSNDYFSSLLNKDENTSGGGGVGSFVTEDMAGTTKFKSTRSWITGWPELVRGRSGKEVEWEFHAIRSIFNVGSN